MQIVQQGYPYSLQSKLFLVRAWYIRSYFDTCMNFFNCIFCADEYVNFRQLIANICVCLTNVEWWQLKFVVMQFSFRYRIIEEKSRWLIAWEFGLFSFQKQL